MHDPSTSALRRRRLVALTIGLVLGVVVGGLLYRRLAPDAAREESLELAPASDRLVDALRENAEKTPASREWIRAFPDSTLKRFRIDEELATVVWPGNMRRNGDYQYDPFCYFARKPLVVRPVPWPEHPNRRFKIRSNALGLRRDSELAATKVGPRVLIMGDSHVEGFCDNAETFAALLEVDLTRELGQTVEVVNAALNGYHLYNHLGVLEKFLHLDLDAAVLTAYGGNDFVDALTLRHLFDGTVRPPGTSAYRGAFESASQAGQSALGQGFLSLKYFDLHPDQVELALETTVELTLEISRICETEGIALVVLYLPALADFPWRGQAETFEEVARILGLEGDALLTNARLGEDYLAQVRAAGLRVIDLTPTFAPGPDDYYWERDLHLDLEGQRAVAEALRPPLEEILTAARDAADADRPR